MSSEPPIPAARPARPLKNEVVVIAHTTLFYWWPVWAVGFILAIISRFDGHKMFILPAESKVQANAEVIIREGDTTKSIQGRDVVILPSDAKIPHKDGKPDGEPEIKTLFVTGSPGSAAYGPIFITVLVLVIVITNVPLRGMWSVLVIVTVLLLSIILYLSQAWEVIFRTLSFLDIRINLGGYLFIASVLFVVWAVVVFVFDRQIYMVFTPGNLKVKMEIGDGEKVYDTTGMTLEKVRSDIFRHWILGLGSGDLIVKTSGAQQHHFEMHNVLWIAWKVIAIEKMMKERVVVGAEKG